MVPEKEKTMIDYLKKVAPGNSIRTVINDLVQSGLGALIIFDNSELQAQNMFEGGFRINCRYTPQKLFELCKMDGAIIVSADLKRILYANVLITPDTSIHTVETGTRHKAAERCAKQAGTFAIATSERRKKTTIYLGNSRYYLKSIDQLIRDIAANLQVLEKQRELFDDSLSNLNVLEMSGLVSAGDVCLVMQRAEMMLKISELLKKQFVEMGKGGSVMNMRYRELMRSVEKRENNVIRDYAILTLKRTKALLSNLTFDGLLDVGSISRLIVEKGIEESIDSKGFRFLSHLSLTDREISMVVKHFGGLSELLDANGEGLEVIFRGRAAAIKEEMDGLREQILSGKIVS